MKLSFLRSESTEIERRFISRFPSAPAPGGSPRSAAAVVSFDNRYTVLRFLDLRIHARNGTLEDAFRHWHKGFRPVTDQTPQVMSA